MGKPGEDASGQARVNNFSIGRRALFKASGPRRNTLLMMDRFFTNWGFGAWRFPRVSVVWRLFSWL